MPPESSPPAHRPVRVGFDARWHNGSGVGTYVRELLTALATAAPAWGVDLVAYHGPEAPDFLRSLPGVRTRPLLAPKYSPQEQLALAAAARRDRLDVLHMPFPVAPLLCQCPVVVTIHDLELLTVAGTGPRGPRRLLTTPLYSLAARKAAAILTNSADTRRDVLACLRPDPAVVHVTPLAAGDAFEPAAGDARCWRAERQAFGIAGPFVFALLGKQVEKKNIQGVLAAHRRYRAQGGDAALVLAGDPRWARAALPELGQAERRGEVLVLGRVEDATLRRLYGDAALCLFPSWHEGFGLPILEALRAGGLVLTSDRGAMRDVAGAAATLVDPGDSAAMAAAIGAACTASPRQRTVRRAAGRARALTFSWRRTAEQTLRVYRQVAAPAVQEGAA